MQSTPVTRAVRRNQPRPDALAAAGTLNPAKRAARVRVDAGTRGYDPWIEIDASALCHNVREVARLAGGRPILAAVKNNGYGLGDAHVGPILDRCPEVGALMVVRVSEALALRKAGVRKPIVNMAEVSDEEALELAARKVRLMPSLDRADAQLTMLARRFGRPIPVHACVDTGMGREGMPFLRARPWLERLATNAAVRIEGLFTMFQGDLEFDCEQLARFLRVAGDARAKGLRVGRLHAAPTREVFLFPPSHLDMVRPGMALYGMYPIAPGVKSQAQLRPVFRLRARVVKVEQMRAGDSASFGRLYVASRPTWIALLPAGHTDGYPMDAKGAQVLINGRVYPIVGAISANHTIVELGDEKSVDVGDVATLVGADHPAVHPDAVAGYAGWVSPYRMLTKLNARLPRRLV